MLTYAFVGLWIIVGILAIRSKIRNKVIIRGKTDKKKGFGIVYFIVTFVLAFLVFMSINSWESTEIVNIVASVLGIIVMNIVYSLKEGITENGLAISFALIPWKDFKNCSIKKENDKHILYYTTQKGYGNLILDGTTENEIRKLVKGKVIIIK